MAEWDAGTAVERPRYEPVLGHPWETAFVAGTAGPLGVRAGLYCFGIFAASTTRVQRFDSLTKNSRRNSGVLMRGSTPSSSKRFCTSGAASALASSWCTRSTTARGTLGRRGERVPRRDVVAGDAGLDRGRHVGQAGKALARRHRERAQRAGLDAGEQRRDEVDREVDVAVARGDDHLAGGLVRHDERVDAGGRAEQLAGEMLRAAGRDGADVHLARDWPSPSRSLPAASSPSNPRR